MRNLLRYLPNALTILRLLLALPLGWLILNERYATSERSLREVIERRERAMAEMEEVQARIESLNPQLMDIENKIGASTSQSERTQLESERSQLATDYNAAQAKEQELLAESQTLERYTSMFQTFVDSLNNQIAAQRIHRQSGIIGQRRKA